MRIVNPRRFTIACIVFAMLLGLAGYGIYRGGVWVYELVVTHFQGKELNENFDVVAEVDEEPIQPVMQWVEEERDPLLEELEWLSRFVLGCESTILYEEGIVSLTFEVIPELALNYYPRSELRNRMLKQSLKVVRDVSKMEHANELERLDLLYVDRRFMTNENPIGEVMKLTFKRDDIHQINWDQQSWLALEAYIIE